VGGVSHPDVRDIYIYVYREREREKKREYSYSKRLGWFFGQGARNCIAKTFDQCLDISFQLLGEDHFVDTFLNLESDKAYTRRTHTHHIEQQAEISSPPWSRSAWVWQIQKVDVQSRARRSEFQGTTNPPQLKTALPPRKDFIHVENMLKA